MYDQAGLPPPHKGEGDMSASETRGAAYPSGRAPIHINWKAPERRT